MLSAPPLPVGAGGDGDREGGREAGSAARLLPVAALPGALGSGRDLPPSPGRRLSRPPPVPAVQGDKHHKHLQRCFVVCCRNEGHIPASGDSALRDLIAPSSALREIQGGATGELERAWSKDKG